MKILTQNKFSGHKDSIFSLGYEKGSDRFYSGAGDGYIVEWSLNGTTDGKLICRVNRPIYCFHINMREGYLFAGTASGNLHVINLKNQTEIRNIEAHQQGLYDMKLVGEQLITAGGDGKVKIWSLKDFSLLQSLNCSDKSARVIALKPDGSGFNVGYSDCMIREFIWGEPTFVLEEFKAHENSVFALAYNSLQQTLLSGGRDAILKEWHHTSLLKELPAHNYHINDIQTSPNGSLIATVSIDKTLKIWDAQTLKLLKVVDRFKQDAHVNSVNKVIWLSNNELITCGDDKLIFHWKIEEF
ncbi:MAG: WD40 repeat domain-containing protein [Bacteroidia bacterium]